MATKIQVAGDICIDVIGIPRPRPAAGLEGKTENWRLTGEIRTHHALGGASLLAEMMQAALPDAEVSGPELQTPRELRGRRKKGALPPSLLRRITRDEVVHSVSRVEPFPMRADAGKKETRLRVARLEGYSGPQPDANRQTSGEQPRTPQMLEVKPPAGASADLVLLDDTGNDFRHTPAQWPAAVSQACTGAAPLILHKLHRPLPKRVPSTADTNADAKRKAEEKAELPLWYELSEKHPLHRIVVISIDDLRQEDALISRGLSWERTAMDLVWQLMSVDRWQELKKTPHLVIRLGLDGAVYWRYNQADEKCKAWLIYDPGAIEGSTEAAYRGCMVGYSSAFTAGLAKALADPPLPAKSESIPPVAADSDGSPAGKGEDRRERILAGIRIGLLAARRVLQLGYGNDPAAPTFPQNELFMPPDDGYPFACQPIPLIYGAAEPDRGYWRLIDSIFSGKADLLHRAVGLVATGARIKGAQAGTPDQTAQFLLDQVPVAVFNKALRAYDRREMESYRALYSLMANYVETQPERVKHPLCVAVFGPPGAGKSFGVEMVGKQLESSSSRAIDTLTFNLSQYEKPEQLAAAFHQVRDVVLGGKIPLVFFDEFDTALDGKKLGWLRYFLGPMQDCKFLDRGSPHPIGQSIFVFAGGTKSSYAEFAAPTLERAGKHERQEFKDAKGPDFLSRLRGTLDIPGLDLYPSFDAYGPAEAFPCEPAIMLRRANILAFQLSQKAPALQDATKAYEVSDAVVRALLHLPRFEHGNRSFEALLEMSRLVDQNRFTPSLLPSLGLVGLHANPVQLMQLLGADYPYPRWEREQIATSIHDAYRKRRRSEGNIDPNDTSMREWSELSPEIQDSNYQQADHIAAKLQSVGLWFRKPIPGASTQAKARQILRDNREILAKQEHDRWVAEKRKAGWIAAPDMKRTSRNDRLRLHNFIFRWAELTEDIKKLDRDAVDLIPDHLQSAGYEIFVP